MPYRLPTYPTLVLQVVPVPLSLSHSRSQSYLPSTYLVPVSVLDCWTAGAAAVQGSKSRCVCRRLKSTFHLLPSTFQLPPPLLSPPVSLPHNLSFTQIGIELHCTALHCTAHPLVASSSTTATTTILPPSLDFHLRRDSHPDREFICQSFKYSLHQRITLEGAYEK